MIETIGAISTVIAIIGVLANNRKLRWCFLLWMVSNALSLAIHADAAIWSLVARDAMFLVLAFDGWFRWKKNKIQRK
ncbi:MAG: nicotinamide mononucleotide transporter family protein [Sedimentisphaerales bacterium]|nr:nicotinamide mononucleotide transporter family protein [Sedimentisphaerales bacterium]